jgi:two-component sensor histidine kinase
MSVAEIVPLRPSLDLTLIGEANHRVANHLSLLASMVQTQAQYVAKGPLHIGRDDVHTMLREVAGKVISVGHLHRTLAGKPREETLDLGDYLVESSLALVKALSLQTRIGIVHRLDCRAPVKAETAQQAALIVSEVVMNAIKHAHPTSLPVEIAIRCGRDAQGRIAVEVNDDGIGLPEDFDPKKDGGVGFRLIRLLAASLGAELDIRSDSLGTSVRLLLPARE